MVRLFLSGSGIGFLQRFSLEATKHLSFLFKKCKIVRKEWTKPVKGHKNDSKQQPKSAKQHKNDHKKCIKPVKQHKRTIRNQQMSLSNA